MELPELRKRLREAALRANKSIDCAWCDGTGVYKDCYAFACRHCSGTGQSLDSHLFQILGCPENVLDLLDEFDTMELDMGQIAAAACGLKESVRDLLYIEGSTPMTKE